jgi:hypothetical protein
MINQEDIFNKFIEQNNLTDVIKLTDSIKLFNFKQDTIYQKLALLKIMVLIQEKIYSKNVYYYKKYQETYNYNLIKIRDSIE